MLASTYYDVIAKQYGYELQVAQAEVPAPEDASDPGKTTRSLV
jgi:hypothetical protein